MADFLFYLLSVVALASSLAVILGRDAVTSAMFMILTFASTAGLYVLLNAWFIAALQIIVYAGAVMVLFLFIVMLLKAEDQDEGSRRLPGYFVATIFSVLMLLGITAIFSPNNIVEPVATMQATEQADALAYGSSPSSHGYGLFTKYMLPVQVAGFLLLVAMIGVIVISKRIGADGEPLESK